MRTKLIVKPEPYEDELVTCDWCGTEGGEFYTPYDLRGEEYPYEKYLDLHDRCVNQFVRKYGPRIWAVMDEVLIEVKKRHGQQVAKDGD